MPCGLVGRYQHLEKHTVSIFRAEDIEFCNFKIHHYNFLSAIMLCHLQLLGLKDGNTLVALQTSDSSSQLENMSSGQFLVVADPAQLAALEVCSLLSFYVSLSWLLLRAWLLLFILLA
jgi:hypothetical protein